MHTYDILYHNVARTVRASLHLSIILLTISSDGQPPSNIIIITIIIIITSNTNNTIVIICVIIKMHVYVYVYVCVRLAACYAASPHTTNLPTKIR